MCRRRWGGITSADMLKVSWFDAMAKLLQSCSIAWPIDAEFSKWQHDVQELRMSVSQQSLERQLEEKLKACQEEEEDPPKFHDLAEVANGCAGAVLSEGLHPLLMTTMGKAVTLFSKIGYDSSEVRKIAMRVYDELVRFSRQKEQCDHISSHMENCDRLMDFPCERDGYEDKSASFVQDMRKALTDLNAIAQAKVKYLVIGGAPGASLVSVILQASAQYKKVNDELLQGNICKAKAELQAAVEALKGVQHMTQARGKEWHSTIAKHADMSALQAHAEQLGVATFDPMVLETVAAKVQKVLKQLVGAAADAGDTSDDVATLAATAAHFVLLAASLVAELRMLKLARTAGLKNEAARQGIQAEIRSIRALGAKEKEALHPTIFRWAYGVLMAQ